MHTMDLRHCPPELFHSRRLDRCTPEATFYSRPAGRNGVQIGRSSRVCDFDNLCLLYFRYHSLNAMDWSSIFCHKRPSAVYLRPDHKFSQRTSDNVR
jgi:hypothetical protein